MVNLDPDIYMNRYPHELSGGQQQRIGVIRALAANPSTILMDEPFSALDPISREQIQDELIYLQSEINKTIVFVTHDMDEAMKIADQIIIMKEGTIVQSGTPQEVLTSPVNDFVRDFIGEKRLDTLETLPALSEFICEDFLFLTDDSSVTAVIDHMVTHQVSDTPVVNNDGAYVGSLNLHKAL